MKTCPKCNVEYPDSQPYCARSDCLWTMVKDVKKPASGGTFTYAQGYKYPLRGFPEVETLGQIATNKRVVMSSVRLIFKNPFRYLLPLLIPFKKNVIKHIVYWLDEIYIADLQKKVLPHKEFSQFSKEILRVLIPMVTTKDREYKTKIINCIYFFVMFFEFDFAYRYRAQDLFDELNKDRLNQSPRKEIKRLLNLAVVRNNDKGQSKKTQTLTKLISLVLLVSPSSLKLVKEALNEIKREEVVPDLFDRYHMARYFDYNFEGKTYDERIKFKEEEDKDFHEQTTDIPSLQATIAVNPNELFYKLDPVEAGKLAESVRAEIMNQHKLRHV